MQINGKIAAVLAMTNATAGNYQSGKSKSRKHTKADARAFEKRVAKRRAKKGYA